MVVSKKAPPKPPKEELPKGDMLERFHPDNKLCEIPITNPIPKPDVFQEYRPKNKREYMDYNISQTDAKLDAGPTKIHIKQTRLDYEYYPPDYIFPEDLLPPPKAKKRPQHGRGPVYEFLDEIRRRKIEAQQIIYREEMERRLKMKLKMLKEQSRGRHKEIVALAGPVWYQELSPNQMNTVDQLSKCIYLDLKIGTTVHCHENISKLGLVLRPNHNHIQFALNHCCQCPVEFLLVLYQILNPTRTTYSLNDRLLLSSVVHLTMRQTLREMHIRIPSPPSKRKKTHHTPKVVKKKHYKNPYLEPFTFEPEPPKHTGKYMNRHIQYPESEYFDYLEELRKEIDANYNYFDHEGEEGDKSKLFPTYDFIDYPASTKASSTVPQSPESYVSSIDKELDDELEAAQVKYNKLTRHNMRRLLRASVYKSCIKGGASQSITQSFTQSAQEMTAVHDEVVEQTGSQDGPGPEDHNTTVSLTVEVRIIDQYDTELQHTGTKYEYRVSLEESDAKTLYFSKHTSTFIIGGIVMGKNGESIPIISGVVAPKICCACTKKKVPVKVKVTGDDGEQVEMDSPTEFEDGTCTCRSESDEEQEVKVVEEEEVVKQEEEVVAEPEEEKLDLLPPFDVGSLVSVKNLNPFDCRCKEIIDQTLDYIRKRKECVDSCLDKVNPTYIIAGSKADEVEDTVPVIEGVKAEKECSCLENLTKRIARFEDRKIKQQAQDALKSTNKKYQIGGVSVDAEGKPTYILSGLMGERSCPKCDAIEAEKKREEERLANMPQIPQGRQKYVISGVQQTPAGNVYVVSGALPIEECSCMKLYDAFVERHSLCMELYERYVEKMKADNEAYIEEYGPLDTKCECLEEQEGEQEGEEEEKDVEMEIGAGVDVDEVIEPKEEPEEVESEAKIPLLGTDSSSNISLSRDLPDGACYECNYGEGELDTDIYLTLEVGDKRTMGALRECTCAEPEPEPVKVVKVVKELAEVKRFIVLKKIPCEPKKQMRIIKDALFMMAKDGFPLAKLPDCHTLPHFKLWMALRCGKCWTMEDRAKLMKLSVGYWNHTEICSSHLADPKLEMSNEKASKYTWAHAKTVKKLAGDVTEAFYRHAKQNVIYDSREFYPTTFSYELPTKAFRDVYFAYEPSKEEEAFACRAWKDFEYIDFKLIRQNKTC